MTAIAQALANDPVLLGIGRKRTCCQTRDCADGRALAGRIIGNRPGCRTDTRAYGPLGRDFLTAVGLLGYALAFSQVVSVLG